MSSSIVQPLLEDFKCAFDHVEKLLDRRQSITSFYLAVNAAIATVTDLLLKALN
jgi:hypothetical protein